MLTHFILFLNFTGHRKKNQLYKELKRTRDNFNLKFSNFPRLGEILAFVDPVEKKVACCVCRKSMKETSDGYAQ